MVVQLKSQQRIYCVIHLNLRINVQFGIIDYFNIAKTLM